MTAVLGVDFSLTSTGLAIAIRGEDVGTERVQSKAPKEATLAEKVDRLDQLIFDIARAAEGHFTDFDLVVMEAPSYGSNNSMTHYLAGAWWLAVRELQGLAPVATVAPSTLKKYITGRGNAEKDAVLAAQLRRFPDLVFGNDAADALGLAGMGVRHLGWAPIDGDLPQVNLSTLASAAWPTLDGGER